MPSYSGHIWFCIAMLKIAATVTSLLLASYLGACGYLYANQRAMLYFPTPPRDVAGAEAISLRSQGETLRILQITNAGGNSTLTAHASEKQAPALIYFGGNAQDVSRQVSLFSKLFPTRTIYLVNYRGYGGSSGTPSEAALQQDALAVFDFVRQRHGDIAVIGQSLGSGVAVYLATARPVSRLALITPFDSIENVARASYPQFPVSILLKDKYLSVLRARDVRAPTLILLAEHDEIIPRASSEALVAALTHVRPDVAVIGGVTHNSICAMGDEDCHVRLASFLRS